MKNLIILMLMVCPLFALAQTESDDSSMYFKNNSFESFTVDLNDITFMVDPRIEFFQTVMLLAGNPNLNSGMSAYKLAILNKYENFRAHPSLLIIREQYRKIFNSIDGPIFFMVHLTNDFQLRKDIDNSDYENNKDVLLMLKHFRKLAKDMDYISFFNSEASFYKMALNITTYNLPKFNEKQRILDYYRVSKNEKEKYNFKIVLNFLGFGNFGPRLNVGSEREFFAIISPESTVGKVPVFDSNLIHNLIWHEFSHSFVNPLISEYYQEFEKTKDLFEPIRKSMSAQAYQTWKVTLNEHLVRAVTCRLAADKFGEPFSILNYELVQKGKRYIYIGLMLNELKQYEKQPNMSFKSVVLKIAKDLQKVNENDISRWMNETEAIRKPDVKELPKIGEANKNLLIVIPKNKNKSSFKTTAWPGVSMEHFHDNWYKYTFNNSETFNVIFHNNTGNQTKDLKNVSGGMWYDWKKQNWVNPTKSILKLATSFPQRSNTIYFNTPGNWKTPMIYYWKESKSFDDFITQFRNKYYPDTQIVDDQTALSMDISKYNLIVFGTLENNQFLQKYSHQLPVLFTKDDIIADQVYTGSDLVYITAWLNPSNPTKSMDLYIAKDMDNLINIDWIPRGGTNYQITRGMTTLKRGNYIRRMKIWRF